MSSFVKQITDSIETRLATLAPGFVKSPYVWSIESNSSKAIKNVFRVIPDAGNSVEGTLRTITMLQKFTVFLTTSFVNKNGGDSVLQTEIEALYLALETITLDAMQRHFAIARIMSVQAVELTAPEIDTNESTATIGASYTILYRME